MTTILQARDEFTAAMVTASIPMADAPGSIAPPYGIIFGEGIDLAHAGRGQSAASFRLVLIAGGWDTNVAMRTLTGMVQSALAGLRALDGWHLQEVRRDNIISIAGGQMLGADVIAARMVDI